VICPKCKELGLKSILHDTGGMVTCMGFMPYYDEDGLYHCHDNNIHTNSYSCSNGHKIVQKSTGKCPNCNWGHDSASVEVY